ALDEQRKGRPPILHPEHRHTAQPMARGARSQRLRIRVALEEQRMFAREHRGNGIVADRYCSLHEFFKLACDIGRHWLTHRGQEIKWAESSISMVNIYRKKTGKFPF